MARSKGSANFAGSLEVLAGAPLDARTVVNVKADLTDSQSYTYVYVGMIVSVKSEGKAYILTAADFTDSNNWSELGSGGSGGGVVEGYFNPTDDLFYEESTYETAITGESGMLYVSLDTNRLYRFNGTIFVVVSDLDATVYQPAGSVLFANLPAASAGTLGFVYDIQDDFVTTSDFIEGAGKNYSAGTNVVVINHGTSSIPIYKYDVLSGRAILPTGGITGQALVKHSNSDGDVEWATVSGLEYEEKTLGVTGFTYNDAGLVGNGETKIFYSIWITSDTSGVNAGLPDSGVLASYDRHYYIEMTKNADGTVFVQRCRKFYTENNTSHVQLFERRCTSSGGTWIYADWIETNDFDTSKLYSSDDSASTDVADADYIPFYDTSASAKKKSLWSNVRSLLKTYFDTLYQGKLTAGSNITMSGNTINATLVRDTYSTTEQRVGTWIDGKPLYQKVVEFNMPTTLSSWVEVANLGTTCVIRDADAIIYNGTGNGMVKIPWCYADFRVDIFYNNDASFNAKNGCIIIWSSNNDYKGKAVKVIVKYTKTTD